MQSHHYGFNCQWAFALTRGKVCQLLGDMVLLVIIV